MVLVAAAAVNNKPPASGGTVDLVDSIEPSNALEPQTDAEDPLTATLTVNSDGTVSFTSNDNLTDTVGLHGSTWYTPGSPAAGAYEVKVRVTTGSADASSGTFDSWLSTDGNPSWSWDTDGGNINTYVVEISIRLTSGAVQDTELYRVRSENEA